MSCPPRVIHCKLQDCFYYRFFPEGATTAPSSGLCFCTHPNNDLIVEFSACSFYRMDWTKKLKAIKKPNSNQGQK